MSTTETTTQTENGAPELTFVHRVTAIPLINASWETIDGALSTHFLTRSPYALGKGLSYSALKLTEPVQKRLAPLIVQADGLANKSLDLVQARYPYPFEAKPEDVKNLVKERRQSATEYANKTIDERVKSPAYNVATGIDQSFAPIVDYFEVAVNKYNSNSSEGAGPSTPPDAKYQYQRALSLSRDLLRQAHAQSLLVQRATETAHSISTLASSSVNNASTRFHNLSNNMSTELAKLQQSTASLSTDLRNTFQQSLESIPSYDKIQESYAEFSEQLSAASKEVGNIVKNKDLPMQEKINKMASEITDRVTPLLDRIRGGLSELIAKGKETAEVAQQQSEEPKQNGNGPHHEQNGQARDVEDEKSE